MIAHLDFFQSLGVSAGEDCRLLRYPPTDECGAASYIVPKELLYLDQLSNFSDAGSVIPSRKPLEGCYWPVIGLD